jgi:hypothetical protein
MCKKPRDGPIPRLRSLASSAKLIFSDVNSELDLREIGWDGVDWIVMAQDRDQWRALMNTVLNFRLA